jgi:hypothetical protein
MAKKNDSEIFCDGCIINEMVFYNQFILQFFKSYKFIIRSSSIFAKMFLQKYHYQLPQRNSLVLSLHSTNSRIEEAAKRISTT